MTAAGSSAKWRDAPLRSAHSGKADQTLCPFLEPAALVGTREGGPPSDSVKKALTIGAARIGRSALRMQN
jgi:hypothetical protein